VRFRRQTPASLYIPQTVLQSLRIRNLALLEEVDLEFEAGFTVVTGETGAGKSILLGALSLLAGERADRTVVRQGAAACEVEASLHFPKPREIDAVLEELGLPACEDGTLILKRSVPLEKAPRIAVNGSLATLAALQRLGAHWIDFHGPGEPRRLLREDCQLDLLDLFARNREALDEYRKRYGSWQDRRAERKRLEGEKGLSPDELDFLKSQLGRMEALDLAPAAIESLELDFARTSRAQELLGFARTLEEGLTGEDGLQGRLAALLREARRLEALDPAGKPLAERLAAAAVELNDLGAEFSALGRELQFEPSEVEALGARMNAWLDLKRRYGGDPRTVAEARDALRRRLEAQGDLAGALTRLDREIAEAAASVRKDGAIVRVRREKAARELARVASANIAELGFAKADFRIRIVPLAEPGPSGDCGCEFLFSPNVGEEARALARIASGGELARVMLALKAVLAELDDVPVLVFDEVDANVGGEIGRVVGEKMARIGESRQVFCVTHLPQVAAQAASHLVVTKDQSGDRAAVRITPIQAVRRERVSELARMLGDRNAKSALAHAEQLLGSNKG
jgi:DNA repair protein RecN (Recombination protein N)